MCGHYISEEQSEINAEILTQVEQNETTIYEIQHVPLKFDQEGKVKLQETEPHYQK